jgi:hypothetical protein
MKCQAQTLARAPLSSTARRLTMAVHKFFPTWRRATHWGIAVAAGVVAAAVAVPVAIKIGAIHGILAAAFGFSLVAGPIALALRFAPVKVTPEGVVATRGVSVRSRLVRWHEIKAVVPISVNGLAQLRLVHDNPFPEELIMLMHLDDLSAIGAFVAAHAGEHHPLAIWLSAEGSASDKSLERTREG